MQKWIVNRSRIILREVVLAGATLNSHYSKVITNATARRTISDAARVRCPLQAQELHIYMLEFEPSALYVCNTRSQKYSTVTLTVAGLEITRNMSHLCRVF